jgi:hypothetical protein
VRLRVKGSQLQEEGWGLFIVVAGRAWVLIMLECEILNKGPVAIGGGVVLPIAVAGGAQVLSAVVE